MSGPFPRRPPEDQSVTRAQMLREMELERRAQESIRAHKLVPMSNMPMPNSGSDEDDDMHMGDDEGVSFDESESQSGVGSDSECMSD